MLNLGIDVGAQTIKLALVSDGKILALGKKVKGFDPGAAAEEAVKEILEKAGVSRQELRRIVATGGGRQSIPTVTTVDVLDIIAAATGVFYFLPSARTVIDIGAEEGKVMKLDDKGNVKDYVRNDKCAAGAGSFIEAMARALKAASLDEFIQLSLASKNKVSINAQCVVFSESEVVSSIHAGISREDISRAVHEAIAERLSTLIRRIQPEKDVVLIGGLTKNKGFIEALKGLMGSMDIIIPEQSEYISAVGAAISKSEGD